MQEQEIRAQCLDLMAVAPSVFVSVIGDDGFPRIRGMLNLRNRSHYPDHQHLYADHDRDFLAYIATNTASRKHAELQQNPRIGLYYSLPEQFLGFGLVGNAEIVEDRDLKSAVWVNGWEKYFPELGTHEDPDFTLLRVLPFEASGWFAGTKFQFAVGS
ncbi:pyridoxamine 5'-phosphate oxidase family protein [Candidatus Bipolaricaulota bacterium]